jgi:hypothetical protein
MLCADALLLLDQLALRITGKLVSELVHWQQRNARACLPSSGARLS